MGKFPKEASHKITFEEKKKTLPKQRWKKDVLDKSDTSREEELEYSQD